MSDCTFGRYAAIDIGTVSCRLLIADVDAEGLHEIAHGYSITNLGEGVDANGYLGEAAMKRSQQQVGAFLDLIASYEDQDHPSIDVVTVATSASRDAKNSAKFVSLLDEMGVVSSIVSGSKEAALSFLGISHEYPNEDVLAVDIGGGSTEISAGRYGQDPVLSRSIDVGCRRVTDRFIHHEPPLASELVTARNWVKENLQGYFTDLAHTGFIPQNMVAVAGTATSVVSVHEEMAVYDRTKVHGSLVQSSVLHQVCERLSGMDFEARKCVVGLDPRRAHVIVAGLVILEEVLLLSGQSSFTVSEADVLQGIILDASQNRQC